MYAVRSSLGICGCAARLGVGGEGEGVIGYMIEDRRIGEKWEGGLLVQDLYDSGQVAHTEEQYISCTR